MKDALLMALLLGAASHVSDQGRTVLDAQLGFARLEDSVRVAPDTRFLIMSVTKAFTGAALVKAVSAGLVDLDEPIAKYVRNYPPGRDPNMTLRTLAAHTAGAPHFNHPARKALYVQHFSTATAAITAIRDMEPVHEPGSKYSYSSGNYNLSRPPETWRASARRSSSQAFSPRTSCSCSTP
jgi:CubicO group peptidase (beta-lactamase class C family)